MSDDQTPKDAPGQHPAAPGFGVTAKFPTDSEVATNLGVDDDDDLEDDQ